MNKLKYLLQNTAIFAISQFTSKVMVFLLLPLYTSYMTTTEYGSADLVFSTISLLLPVFTVQIASAVMRFAIEDKEKGNLYYIKGLKVTLIGFVILLCLLPVFIKINIFGENLYLFYILYLANAVYNLLSYYARAIDRLKLVGIVGVINTAVVVGANIVLLIFLKQGVFGYLISYIAGYVVGSLIFAIVMNRDICITFNKNSKTEMREMTKYSLPLVPNSISWWGVSTANKYIINGYLSKSVLGLYSVALKIPTIINTIQNILAEALVLSVLKEYDSEEKDEKYFSLLYKMYNFCITFFTAGIILSTKMLAKILFANDFYDGWIYVPLLCIPSVWGALAGYLGTFYSASKKNNGMFLSTVLGGVITIVFSFATIKTMGIIGIIIGNVISYFVIFLYRYIDTKKFVNLKINMFKDVIGWLLLFAQSLAIMYLENALLYYSINVICVLLILLLNKDLLGMFIKVIKDKLFKRRA
ncbi:MAG: hypothetical protein E7568_02970 [Ruminococcaceae bacterium]|nr:hypothetical protein [Oscillospiraceae bacterium]